MKRNFALGLACLMLLLSGCGGGGEYASSSSGSYASVNSAADYDYAYAGEGVEAPMAEAEYWDSPAESAYREDSSVYQNPNAKLIRQANLSIQTTQFDQAAGQLEELVNGLGGYFQDASVNGGGYWDVNARRWADYTVRVPAEKYNSFLNLAGDLGYVTSKSESTEDIGEQYYDTQARLKTKLTKQERLQELLSRAENMEDIISLEGALSDVEYEIEQLSSTLNRYDSLVGFATIHISLQEVQRVTEETGTTSSLPQRMAAALGEGLEDFLDGLEDLLIWLSYNIFGLLFFALVVCAVVLLVRKLGRGRRQRREEKRREKEAQKEAAAAEAEKKE